VGPLKEAHSGLLLVDGEQSLNEPEARPVPPLTTRAGQIPSELQLRALRAALSFGEEIALAVERGYAAETVNYLE
jgi:hypothetical protein